MTYELSNSVLTDTAPPSDPSRTPGGGASPFGTLSILPVPISAGAPLATLHAVQLPEAITPASGSILRQPIRGAGRFNWSGTRCRWSISTACVQHPQKSGRRFPQGLWLLLCVVAHAAKHAARSFVSVPKSIGVVRNVGR